MKKKTKNFLIAFIAAVIFFIISLIVQYYLSVAVIKARIIIAILCGIIGSFITIGSGEIHIKPNSIDNFIFKFITVYIAITYTIILSTMGNPICQNVCIILLLIGIPLAMIDLLYLAIKELIKEYKNYKERQ